MRKIALSVLLVLIGFTLFANGDAESSESKELTVWLKQTFASEYDQGYVEKFQEIGESKGYDVEVEIIPTADLSQKLVVAIESKSTPDISTLIPADVPQFHARNLLAPVSDTISAIEGKYGKIIPGQIDIFKIDGDAYTIPWYGSANLLYYRKDLLKKAGYSAPPKTWDELREMAIAMTDAKNNVYGFGFTFSNSDDCSNHTRAGLWSHGGSLWNKDGKTANFNTSESIAFIKMLTDIYLEDKSMPLSTINWDDGGNNTAYLTGQVAMTFNSGSIRQAYQSKPEYEKLDKVSGVAEYPAGPDGIKQKAMTVGWGIFNNGNVEGAKDVIVDSFETEWYNTNLESYGAPNALPVFAASSDRPFWDDADLQAFLGMMQYQVPLGYPASTTTAVGEVMTSKILNETLQDVIVNGTSVEDAVAAAHKKIQAVGNKY